MWIDDDDSDFVEYDSEDVVDDDYDDEQVVAKQTAKGLKEDQQHDVKGTDE